MSLIGLIITLVVVGVLLWLINNYVPMDPKIKTILIANACRVRADQVELRGRGSYIPVKI
jgi:hypothetical protein